MEFGMEFGHGILGISLDPIISIAPILHTSITVIPLQLTEYEYNPISMDFETNHVPVRVLCNQEYTSACVDQIFHFLPIIDDKDWVIQIELLVDSLNIPLKAIIDTGASSSQISKSLMQKLSKKTNSRSFPTSKTKIGLKIPATDTVFTHVYDKVALFAVTEEF
jgi:Aspartyl protease